MPQDPITKPDKPLDAAIRTLAAVTEADDLRWLSAVIAIERLDQRVEIRGIKYFDHEPGAALRLTLDAIADLSHDDLVTVRLVIDLLYKALRPVAGEGRGDVQIRTIKRDYAQIDFETGLQERDEGGKPVYMTFHYPYVYIRLYAGKGDGDHRRQKLLGFYADRGSGKAREGGGFGGYVAKALTDGLTTKDQILDAWHAGKLAYAEFVDGIEAMIKFLQPAPDQPDQNEQPGQAEFPNLFE